MSQVTVRIQNLDALKSAFKQSPETVAHHIRNMSAELALYLEGQSKDRAPTDTSRLKGSINTQLNIGPGGLGAIVATGTNYAAAVHEGSRPHWTSVKNLADWARRKGISPYAVQKAIAKHGTKPHPFMKDAVNENETTIQKIADANITAAVTAVARSTI